MFEKKKYRNINKTRTLYHTLCSINGDIVRVNLLNDKWKKIANGYLRPPYFLYMKYLRHDRIGCWLLMALYFYSSKKNTYFGIAVYIVNGIKRQLWVLQM